MNSLDFLHSLPPLPESPGVLRLQGGEVLRYMFVQQFGYD